MKRIFSNILLSAIALFILASIFSSCNKNAFLTTGGDIRFSKDTVKLDTVFTSIGSYTDYFKIYNRNNKRIKLSEVKLEKGSNSMFRLNVDGDAGMSVKDVEIAANDSIYVFVDVNINPNSALTPFVVEDKVMVTLNGNTSNVPLQAYGQNAHYIVDSLLDTQTWINDKPYVIVQSALVKPNHTLTIEKGCRIYMHQDSKLFVQGTLTAIGTKQDSIIFQGDRLESFYPYSRDNPGEWAGLHFLRGSISNLMEHCIVKNAGNSYKYKNSITNQIERMLPSAVQVDPDSPAVVNAPKLIMKKCIVYNSAGYGVVAFNTNVTIENSLIHTCALQNLAIVLGGKYNISNCTIATYGGTDIAHTKEPSVAIVNYLDVDDVSFESNDLEVTFDNNIIYGSLEDELFVYKKGSNSFVCNIDHCLIKSLAALPSIVTVTNSQISSPQIDEAKFVDAYKYDFHLQSTSAAKGNGKQIVGISEDLDDKPRANPPSKGCYEAL
jgi:hypothetical protein